MGKKSGPPPPDYTALAEKTNASNTAAMTQQTWANRANQTNPWGSTTWDAAKEIDPATGQEVTKWTENTNVSPEIQQALDSQLNIQNQRSQMAEGMLGRIQNEYSQPMDWSGLSGWGQGPQAGNLQSYTNPYGNFGSLETGMGRNGQPLQRGLDFGGVQAVDSGAQARQKAEDAIYKSATSRLDPQFQQQQTNLETQLANQGISRNSEAYTRAMDDFNRSKTDAYGQAQNQAFMGGGAEAQRSQGMDLALRGQQVGEIGQQGAFWNQAAGQGFGQDIAGANARNQAQMLGMNFGLQQQQQAFGQNQQAGAQNFNQSMALANYQNQLRQQQLQEAMTQRGFSLNEMQALMNGQQVNMPQFGSYGQAGNAGGVDYSGAGQQQFGAAMQQQQMRNQATGQILGAVGGAAGMFNPFSFG